MIPSTVEGLRLYVANEIAELNDLLKARERYEEAFLGCDHWPRLPIEERSQGHLDFSSAWERLVGEAGALLQPPRPWLKFWA